MGWLNLAKHTPGAILEAGCADLAGPARDGSANCKLVRAPASTDGALPSSRLRVYRALLTIVSHAAQSEAAT